MRLRSKLLLSDHYVMIVAKVVSVLHVHPELMNICTRRNEAVVRFPVINVNKVQEQRPRETDVSAEIFP